VVLGNLRILKLAGVSSAPAIPPPFMPRSYLALAGVGAYLIAN